MKQDQQEETAHEADAGDSPEGLSLEAYFARPEPVRMRSYALGRYTVHVAPLPGAHHMAAYRVYAGAKMLGRTITPPSLEDCKRMEHPPEVPPAKFVAYNARPPGRPKKGSGPKPPWWEDLP